MNGRRRAPLAPTQRRSRDRFEQILRSASELLLERGGDAWRMSDLVTRTGVPFGSLYQYFPDKSAVIATLADRYNASGRVYVETQLEALNDVSDLHTVLCRITDGYYRYFLDEPVVHRVWQATQGDRALQRIDEEDNAFLAGLLRDALIEVAPSCSQAAIASFSLLLMTLIGSAVRHAIALEPDEAARALRQFKALLPRDLGGVD
jgi:AcrR family transcriptional regulator